MRLIDADALEERMNNQYKYLAQKTSEYDLYTCGYYDAVCEVEEAPTIDAEPVRHGRWEEIRNAYGELEGWLCKCGREVKTKDNYCPNCGAKMDGDLPHNVGREDGGASDD